MGDGTTSEPPIDSSSDDSSEDVDDGTQPTALDDHKTDSEPDEPEEPEDTDASNAPSGTPTGGGVPSGGAPSGDVPAPTPTPEEPSGEEPDDGVESERESSNEPRTPEDNSPEQEPEQPEHEEPEDSDDTEQEDEDDDDDEEEEQEAQIVVRSDAWDSIAWGIYPVRLQLKEEYGDQVQFDDRLVPVRDFESSEKMAHHWEKWEPRHGMPVNTDIWLESPPESTELANRAFEAAREQSVPLAKRFMRRLKMAVIVEGTDIEDRETLFELAQNVGLDMDQLEESWDDVHIPRSSREVETPKTTIHVDGETITQPGLVTIDDLKTPLKRAGLEADDPQPLPGFVDEHGPVALKEVQQVYDYTREEALDKLQSTEEVVDVEYGDTTFWVTM